MRTMTEPTAMAEIRKIRNELSQEMKDLSPREQAARAKEAAERLEKKFGLDLPRLKTEPAKT